MDRDDTEAREREAAQLKEAIRYLARLVEEGSKIESSDGQN